MIYVTTFNSVFFYMKNAKKNWNDFVRMRLRRSRQFTQRQLLKDSHQNSLAHFSYIKTPSKKGCNIHQFVHFLILYRI